MAVAATIDFDQYREEKIYKDKPAKPNLASHKDARTYRTVLRSEAKKGSNFAGQYRFVEIGCGTECIIVAVIDERTGQVYFPENIQYILWSKVVHEPFGPVYKPNSRLLIVYGQINIDEAENGISYYEWKNGEFRLIKFEPQIREINKTK